MTKEDLVNLLYEGVDAWNAWREAPDAPIDLSCANLSCANLSNTNLREADLREAQKDLLDIPLRDKTGMVPTTGH